MSLKLDELETPELRKKQKNKLKYTQQNFPYVFVYTGEKKIAF